jgi:hypothetical protein
MPRLSSELDVAFALAKYRDLFELESAYRGQSEHERGRKCAVQTLVTVTCRHR